MLKRCWTYGLAALVVSGCGDDSGPSGVAGELGLGAFQYVCVDSSDPSCGAGETADRFPNVIGVQGSFDLEFDIQGSDVGRVRITPAAPDIIDQANDQFFAARTGVVAMLAKRTSDGRVLDFVHLEVTELASLRIEAIVGSPELVWETGQTETLRAVPLGKDRAVLAGARDFDWSTSDASVVRLERGNPTRTMQFKAVGPGLATVSVTSGGVETEIAVTVERGSAPPPDAGPPENDAGADASEGGAAPDGGDAAPVGSDAAPDGDVSLPDVSVPLVDAGVPPDGAPVEGGGPAASDADAAGGDR